MTCIIGVETEKGILMGCDSAAASGWDIYATRLKKVFRRGEFLIGYTTSFRMGQLLQYKLGVEPQAKEQDDLEYLATTFIDAVKSCLKDGDFTKVENERQEGGEFLVGYRGKLYEVATDFQVNSSQDGYMAIGCGAACALGSLYLSDLRLGALSEDAILTALKAAAHFNNGVSGPFYVTLQEK